MRWSVFALAAGRFDGFVADGLAWSLIALSALFVPAIDLKGDQNPGDE